MWRRRTEKVGLGEPKKCVTKRERKEQKKKMSVGSKIQKKIFHQKI